MSIIPRSLQELKNNKDRRVVVASDEDENDDGDKSQKVVPAFATADLSKYKTVITSAVSRQDLSIFYGEAVMARGTQYHEDGKIVQLSVREKDKGFVLCGSCIGNIENTIYDVETFFTSDKIHTSKCSCPVAVACKHSVAQVLQYVGGLSSFEQSSAGSSATGAKKNGTEKRKRRQPVESDRPKKKAKQVFSDEEEIEPPKRPSLSRQFAAVTSAAKTSSVSSRLTTRSRQSM